MRHYFGAELPGMRNALAEHRTLTYESHGQYKAAIGTLWKAAKASYAEGDLEKTASFLERAYQDGLAFNKKRDRNIRKLADLKANIAFLYARMEKFEEAKIAAEQASLEHLIANYNKGVGESIRSKGEQVAQFWFGKGRGDEILEELVTSLNFTIHFEHRDVATGMLKKAVRIMHERELEKSLQMAMR